MTTIPHQTDSRMNEILDSIKTAFASKGFDGASMQDLARSAGMSAGNFYRYFPSKDAIIAAIVSRDLGDVQREFNDIIRSPHPREMFRDLIRRRVEVLDGEKGAIMAEISAFAARSPEIAALMSQFEATILGYLTAVFGRIAGVSEVEAQEKFAAHGRLIMLLVHGMSMRGSCGSAGTVRHGDRELAELVLLTIERMLTDIGETKPVQHSLPTQHTMIEGVN